MHAVKHKANSAQVRRLLTGGLLVAGMTVATSTAMAWSWGWGNGTKGSGNIVTSTRAVAGFQGVELEVPADVKLVQGSTESVVLETDDNIAPLIETVVEQGQLVVRMAKRSDNVQTKTLRMTITAPSFTALSIAGSGTVRADALQTPKLKTSISGSGDVRLQNLTVGELTLAISGSGDFEALGHADAMKASVAGSGDVRTKGLETKQVKVSIAGSGNVTTWATEALHVSIAGSGDVQYYGDPSVKKSIAGSGSVRRLDSKP